MDMPKMTLLKSSVSQSGVLWNFDLEKNGKYRKGVDSSHIGAFIAIELF